MTAVDTEILLWVRGWSSPWLDAFFLASHALGRLPGFAALATAMALWHALGGRHRLALGWLAVGLATLLALEAAKALFARPRPALWPALVIESNWSFPSGHALASAALYPLAAWDAARRWPRRAVLLYGAAVAGALWLGVGRVYLGVHWPSDVVAGWAAGALIALAAARWLGTLTPRPQACDPGRRAGEERTRA